MKLNYNWQKMCVDSTAFFALEELSESNPVIWAINGYEFLSFLAEKGYLKDDHLEYDSNGDFFNATFEEEIDFHAIGFARPYRLHERIAIQQGTFLYPLNMKYSFEDNLYGMLNLKRCSLKEYVTNVDPDLQKRLVRSPVVKIVLDRNMRLKALNNLHRMNINNATLFPGLDGYTRSLRQEIYKFSKI